MSARALLVPLLRCPSCAAEFEPYAVNVSQEIASCRHCGKVVDLAVSRATAQPKAEIEAPPPRAELLAPPRKERQRVSMPDEMDVSEQPGGVVVTWSRSLSDRLRRVGFAATVSILGVVQLQLHGRHHGQYENALSAFFIVPGLYCAAAFLLNQVRLIAAEKSLSVKVGPVPWPGSRRLPPGEVRQLFCELRETPDVSGKVIASSYVLSAIVGPQERRVELLTALPEARQALWLEQTLEKALRIRDVQVGGELDA